MLRERNAWTIALALWGLLSGAALVAALMLHDTGLLSLSPPASEANPTPAPDTTAETTFALHLSAYTAWVALILLMPVYFFFWGRRGSPRRRAIWRAFWTVSCGAYLVHLAVSMGLFYRFDLAAMLNTSRVSAFGPAMVIALWWPLDVAFSHTSAAKIVRIQRALLHAVVFALFVGGSALMGELMTVRILGLILFAVAAAMLIIRLPPRILKAMS